LKVLIVKLSAFGDIIHALPALNDVLAHPEVSEVHWLVDARFAFVTDVFPPQVKVHKVALKGTHRLRHAWQMIQTLRHENFDIILDLQGLIKSGLMAWAAATSRTRVYGFNRQQSPEYPNHWFVKPVPFHPDEQHVVQKYRRIAQAPFTHANDYQNKPIPYSPPHITACPTVPQLGQKALRNMAISIPFTLIHVGGSYHTKRLPDAQWKILIEQLSNQQHVLILWGNAEEKTRAEQITHNSPHTTVAPQCFSLPVLLGLSQHASAYIGQDTGVTHLVAAGDCPTVTLWGATAPWRMGALGSTHRHVVARSHCSPCFNRQCDNFICMPSISTHEILNAWQEIQR